MTPLLVMFTDRFGTEAYDYDPESILECIRDEWAVEPHQNAFDRLMVGIAIQTSDEFFQVLSTFVDFCNSLSGGILDPSYFDPATTAECTWGLLEASIHDPTGKGTLRERLSEDIVGYIQEVCKYEGYYRVPAILEDIVGSQAPLDIEDKDLYKSVWDTQTEKREEVETWLKSRLQLVGQQLASIEVTDGNNDAVQHFARRLQE